jgi:hypothetical protein
MKGYFSEETLDNYARLAAEKLDVDFAEGDLYDFTTCIRPDGSAYGTGGKCRKGSEGETKAKTKKPEQSVADRAMEMVKANARARGLTEIKAGGSKPSPNLSLKEAGDAFRRALRENQPKEAVKGYDWRKQSGTFRKADND